MSSVAEPVAEPVAVAATTATPGIACVCTGMRELADTAQRAWAATPVADRLRILKAARHRMAAQAEAFAEAISPTLPRSQADTLVAELLPLLDACKFLERNAARVLKMRKPGRRGRPFTLRGVEAEVRRVPHGSVLVIGPANFPLFLPGTQVLQALAAGNRVLWKPGAGGRPVALLLQQTLTEAGLPEGLLHVTDESVEAAQFALSMNPDKVVFTGSADTGRSILRTLSQTATPATMELSGSDAVIVLPGANLSVAAKAIAFGLRLNGGQVCMSPRRLFAESATLHSLLPLLEHELAAIAPVALNSRTAAVLREYIAEAEFAGAELRGTFQPGAQAPLLIEHATPQMRVARSDVFAPVLSLLELPSLAALPEAYDACPYALTAAIFCGPGEQPQVRLLTETLRAGTILINDLIAPTADPRIPFGGRGASGYGVTRGEEGLLDMTVPKVVLTRRGGAMRHLEPTLASDTPLLASLVRVLHAGAWSERWHALQSLFTMGRKRPHHVHEQAHDQTQDETHTVEKQ